MTETEWQLWDAEPSLLLIPVLSHLLIHPSYPMPGPLLLPPLVSSPHCLGRPLKDHLYQGVRNFLCPPYEVHQHFRSAGEGAIEWEAGDSQAWLYQLCDLEGAVSPSEPQFPDL